MDNYYADKVIERRLKMNKKWGARDRRFYAETVYDIVRWWLKLWGLLNTKPIFDEENLWKLWGLYYFIINKEIPDFKEVQFLDSFNLDSELYRISKDRATFHSLPSWLYDLGAKELGAEWEEIVTSLNQMAPVILRANILKCSTKDLAAILQTQGISARLLGETHPSALQLNERKNVFQTEAFKNGLFEVQDASSQLVAPFLEPVGGMRVVDACAGAGGKTLHIATIMRNLGKIVALDPLPRKLEELKKRTRRAGIFIVEPRTIESSKTIKRLHGTADRLLLDVPCSGLGVLRRNPDAKWKLSLERLEELKKIQQDILEQYASIVKVGGIMVYSTCSILPSENGNQIQKFLSTREQKWTLDAEINILPHKSGYDGFYMARLIRKT